MFGENEGVKPLASAAGGEEALAEGLGIGLGLGPTLASLIDGGVRETDDQAADHAEDPRRVRITDPTAVLAQSDIQAVVEAAFDDPVPALERQHALGLQFPQATTADQEHPLGVPVPVAMRPALQARRHPRSGEAHLGRRHLQAV